MADTHICPQCSKECVYKNGIMCTIQGCIKDGTAKNGNINDVFNMFGNIFNNGNQTTDFFKGFKK